MNQVIFYFSIAMSILFILDQIKRRFLTSADSTPEGIFSPQELSHISSKNLLTTTELNFYKLLREALPDYEIHAQVAVYQTLKIDSGNHAQKIFNRLNRMTFDFVITDQNTKVIAVVELDDKSHARSSTKKRDSKKDALLAHIGKPLIRVQADSNLTVDQLKLTLLGAISSGTSANS